MAKTKPATAQKGDNNGRKKKAKAAQPPSANTRAAKVTKKQKSQQQKPKQKSTAMPPALTDSLALQSHATASPPPSAADDEAAPVMFDDKDAQIVQFDQKITLAIGHLLVDAPTHMFWSEHVGNVVAACGEGDGSRAKLQAVLKLLNVKAAELQMRDNVQAATKAITNQWAEKQSGDLADDVSDDDALASITAGVIGRRIKQQGTAFDASKFFNKLQQRIPALQRISPGANTGIKRSPQCDLQPEDMSRLSLEPAAATAQGYGNPLGLSQAVRDAALGLELYWNAHLRADKDYVKGLVATCIRSAADVYKINHLASRELTAHTKGRTLDIDAALRTADSRWAQFSGQEKYQWNDRFSSLQTGLLEALVKPDCDQKREQSKQAFRQVRTPGPYGVTLSPVAGSTNAPPSRIISQPRADREFSVPSASWTQPVAANHFGGILAHDGQRIKAEYPIDQPIPIPKQPTSQTFLAMSHNVSGQVVIIAVGRTIPNGFCLQQSADGEWFLATFVDPMKQEPFTVQCEGLSGETNIKFYPVPVDMCPTCRKMHPKANKKYGACMQFQVVQPPLFPHVATYRESVPPLV